jgi:tRNA threonylcarbamoyladenosine biosynthesis protein TsaB
VILLLDTSTPVCRVVLVDDRRRIEKEWQADRTLAKNLLRYLTDTTQEVGYELTDITGIGIMSGPGSFTGLRIGMAVGNTLADSLAVPIVGARGDDWQAEALARLGRGESDGIVLPYYGSEAHITKPRK